MNSSTNEETLTVGLVGFGEAGQAFGCGFGTVGWP